MWKKGKTAITTSSPSGKRGRALQRLATPGQHHALGQAGGPGIGGATTSSGLTATGRRTGRITSEGERPGLEDHDLAPPHAAAARFLHEGGIVKNFAGAELLAIVGGEERVHG